VIPFGLLDSGETTPKLGSYSTIHHPDCRERPTVLTNRLFRTAYYCRFAGKLSNGGVIPPPDYLISKVDVELAGERHERWRNG
jgi:hypothetical protein